VDTGLPEGWTIDRVCRVSGVSEATVLSLERLVVLEKHNSMDYVTLQPEIIISFHELCLVSAGDEWFMGSPDSDGSVICWGSYGSDLEEAIRGL
jgi:hypothetical protein